MPRYVALLRAINVGGRTVKMDRLRELFEDLGFRNVQTVIASGNVLFDAPSKNPSAVEKKIEAQLFASLGYAVETFVRTPAELVAAAEADVFRGSERHSPTNALYVGFVKTDPTEDACDRLAKLNTEIDEFRVHGREYYWSCRKSIGQSKVTGAAIERALKVPSTVRNISTVRRLSLAEG